MWDKENRLMTQALMALIALYGWTWSEQTRWVQLEESGIQQFLSAAQMLTSNWEVDDHNEEGF